MSRATSAASDCSVRDNHLATSLYHMSILMGRILFWHTKTFFLTESDQQHHPWTVAWETSTWPRLLYNMSLLLYVSFHKETSLLTHVMSSSSSLLSRRLYLRWRALMASHGILARRFCRPALWQGKTGRRRMKKCRTPTGRCFRVGVLKSQLATKWTM